MLIKQSDKNRIEATLMAASQKLASPARIQDGILWLRVLGNFENGKTALRALLAEGIAMVIDDDFTTDESKVIWKKGAEAATVWIDFVDGQPLFREGEVVSLG